ncbi:4'-phosphopantetheinyl transferase family protein [Aquimarina pacifica]|uniref:4'-phosphopantetheinyl transferase family protein n=1 Tax=Aquimarina pacifica TaxID=1296415 RepID=UPI0004726066|nr:4'-phosphopantetheinyl transferase superfamily protein [Aquimarina pacifica]
MVNILYSQVSEKNHELLINEFLRNYSDGFQDKVMKYRDWKDAQLSLLGRILLEHGVKEQNKVSYKHEIKYTTFNKPYFEDETIKFNISHSGNIVVCAITKNSEIGIDIEVIKDIDINDFRCQMTNFEWRRLVDSANLRESFFDYWTQKEAVIKTDGRGLSIPLKSFEVINGQTNINKSCFSLKEIKLDHNYKCHLAIKDRRPIIINKIQFLNSSIFLDS